jgi:hypothetical protein
MIHFLTAYIATIIFVFGTVIGSFLNVLIYRLPIGMDFKKGNSICTSCKHQLNWKDLFPLFSWIFLGGKCRYCKAPISPRYPIVEALNGISYVLPKAGAGNYTAVQKYIAKQLSSDPRVYEEPTIAIYNASNTDGLGAKEKAVLEEKGYTVTLVENAPAGEYEKGISLYAVNPEKAGTKRMLIEEYNYDAKSKDDLPAGIAPKYDFIIIINDK